jgi:polysaccharide biosynthesis protein PslH
LSILFLAHRLPYPPDRGDRIRSWHVLKALAQLGPVHVATPIEDDGELRHIATVERVAASVTTSRRSTSKLSAIAGALATGLPASVVAFQSQRLKAQVRALIAAHGIETIYAFSGQMAGYVPPDFAGRLIMDFVDMDSAKFAQQGGFANRQEAKRLLAWEIMAAKRAEVSLFVSAAEATLFRDKAGIDAAVLENGIDLVRFAPDAVDPLESPTPLIVFTGQMDYAPNVEAVADFVRGSLPAIRAAVPQARFAIVGRAPTAAVRALACDHVIVTGEVDDTRPWLAGADVVVAPLKLARGVQNKVLEAMAMGKAVVLSAGAAEGIDAENGRDFLVADAPAAGVIALLRDAGRRLAIGGAARARMEARYSWDAQLAPLAGFVGL